MQTSKRLWDLYTKKKFSKCYLRQRRKSITELNKELQEKGSSIFYAPYVMCPLTPTVGNYPPAKEIESKYTKECDFNYNNTAL